LGVFNVKAKIWKVGEYQRAVDIELTVDTGSTYTVVPAVVLEQLGVERQRSVNLRIADGTVISRPYGEVGMEVAGFKASATPVIFGYENVYLLGAVTMEQLGLAPDPVQKRLVTTTALMMRQERRPQRNPPSLHQKATSSRNTTRN